MYLVVNENAEAIAVLLTKVITGLIKENPNIVLGLTTDSSSIATYKLLVEDHQKNKTDWSNIKTFNLDEYVALTREDKHSYYYAIQEELFNYINIKKENIYFPNALGDIEKNAAEYEELIKKHGPINLQVLAIGSRGDIGFNEPGSDINSVTRVVTLNAATKCDKKRFFNDDEKRVPQQAITMGIATILKAKAVVLLAAGKDKADAVKALIQGRVSAEWPCSYLQKHQSVLVLVDREAASLLDSATIKEHGIYQS